MTIKTTIINFQLSNIYEEYKTHKNAKKQQTMFKKMGFKTFYIAKSLKDPQRATVIFQEPENNLYDIFMNPETISVFEASGHIYVKDKNHSLDFFGK